LQPFAAQMHYLALATDYDGTLAEDGKVRPEVVASLVCLKASGRKLVLVTGRELPALVRRAERRTKNGPAVTR